MVGQGGQRADAFARTNSCVCVVAAADGNADDSEAKRLASWLVESPLEIPAQARLVGQYRELTTRFVENFDEVLEDVRALIIAAKNAGDARGLVVAAAQAAVVADGRIDDREEVAIREICELLELKDE